MKDYRLHFWYWLEKHIDVRYFFTPVAVTQTEYVTYKDDCKYETFLDVYVFGIRIARIQTKIEVE